MLKNRIKEIRSSKKITIQQLADLVGTSHPQIIRLENGTRRLTLDWMQRIASALDCEPKDLIGETTEIEEVINPVNKDLLQTIIEELEILIAGEKITISAKDKSKTIAIVYNHIISEKKKKIEADELKERLHLVLRAINENN